MISNLKKIQYVSNIIIIKMLSINLSNNLTFFRQWEDKHTRTPISINSKTSYDIFFFNDPYIFSDTLEPYSYLLLLCTKLSNLYNALSKILFMAFILTCFSDFWTLIFPPSSEWASLSSIFWWVSLIVCFLQHLYKKSKESTLFDLKMYFDLLSF